MIHEILEGSGVHPHDPNHPISWPGPQVLLLLLGICQGGGNAAALLKDGSKDIDFGVDGCQNAFMKSFIIYSDGSGERNPGPGGWSAILRFGESQGTIFGDELATTNDRVEMRAAMALNDAHLKQALSQTLADLNARHASKDSATDPSLFNTPPETI